MYSNIHSVNIMHNDFVKIRMNIIQELSKKKDVSYVMEGAMVEVGNSMPRSVYDFFMRSDLKIDDFAVEVGALADLVVRIRKYKEDVTNFYRSTTTTVDYNQVSQMLDRYDLKHEISGGKLKIAQRKEVSITSPEIKAELQEVLKDKYINISSSVENEEKKQPYKVKEKNVRNFMVADELEKVYNNEYSDVIVKVKDEYSDPYDYKKLKLDTESADLNYLVHELLPDTRKANPDYLYAIGHRDAHFYTKEKYLHDRFVAIVSHSFFDEVRPNMRVYVYRNTTKKKLEKLGCPVLMKKTEISKEDIICIHPEICDENFEGVYEDDQLPDYMQKMNRFMVEVNAIKSLCTDVYHPYYPYWKGDRFDKNYYAPFTFHRPFVFVSPIEVKRNKQVAYFYSCLKLSSYRTNLQLTGRKYEYLLPQEEKSFQMIQSYMDTINKQKIIGNGYVPKNYGRALVPTGFTFQENEKVYIEGKEQDLVPSTVFFDNTDFSAQNQNGKLIVKNMRNEKRAVEYRTDASMLMLSRYIRNIEKNSRRLRENDDYG